MLRDIEGNAFNVWEQKLQELIKGSSSVEAVAQRVAQNIYDSFRGSVVLSRFYATIPYKKLPEKNRQFAATMAKAHGATGLLGEDTPVLSLLGTAGDNAEWNSRHTSKGHVGIPLISTDFIDGIPMIARLLQDLGVSLGGTDGAGSGIETSKFGRLGGLFYVEDARTAVDQGGRKIISAQDFVAAHGIRTVFGTAGLYFLTKTFITVIVFTRETISRKTARHFMPLGGVITSTTSDLVNRGKLFAQ
jgi:hypothetical protein